MSLNEKCRICRENGLVTNCMACMVNFKRMEIRINKRVETMEKHKSMLKGGK